MKSAMITILLVFSFGAFAGEGWMTNFEEAKAKAAKENKAMLVDFTGSDWCGWCIRLQKEVFTKDEFKNYAKDKFILVELDYPKSKPQTPEIKAQNQALVKTYSVRGYPTILLMDAKGRPFAKTGYKAGGPEAYNKHLDEFLATKTKFDGHIKGADGAEGSAKAAKLVDALKLIDTAYLSHYDDVMKEIKTLDPEDKTGFVKTQGMKAAAQTLGQKVMGLARGNDKEGAKKAIDSFLSEYKPEGELKQKVLFNKVFLLPYPPKTPEDLSSVDKLMDEIIAVKPDSPVAGQCKNVKKQVDTFRAKINKQPK